MNVELTWKEEIAFSTLIEKSIVARYHGDLERLGPDREGEYTYRPRDHDQIRELLVALWGAHITATEIDAALESLTQDGASEWPQGWCDDDEDGRSLSALIGPD